jgi:hypothetical protein
MKRIIPLLAFALCLSGCAIFQKKPSRTDQPVIKAEFGPAEEQLNEFAKSFDEARAKGLTAEEKIKLVVEKAKELEKMN